MSDETTDGVEVAAVEPDAPAPPQSAPQDAPSPEPPTIEPIDVDARIAEALATFREESSAREEALIERVWRRANGLDEPATDLEVEAQRAEVAERLERLEQANARAAEDAEILREQLFAERRDYALRSALLGTDLDRRWTEHAMAVVSPRVSIGADGEAYWLAQDGEVLPVAEGVARWARSPDASPYLPARAPSGSGDGPARKYVRRGETAVDRLNRRLNRSL